MVRLNIQGLEKELKSSIFRPFYLLIGLEFYLLKESMNLIKRHLMNSKDDLDFNFHQFYLSEEGVSKILEVARTLPVFSKRRLIFVREADLLKEKDLKAFSSYFKYPLSTTVLVFIVEKENLLSVFKKKIEFLFKGEEIQSAKNKKHSTREGTREKSSEEGGKSKGFQALEALKRKPCFLEAKKINESQIPFWIQKMAKKKNLSLNAGAISLMSQILGTNLFLMDQELERFSLNLVQKQIGEDEVLKFLMISKKENVFELMHWIGRRRLKKALRVMKNLLEYGESASLILVLIFRHIRLLWSVHLGLKENLSKEGLAQKTKVPSFFISDYMEQARLWNESEIAYAFRSLHETDQRLKLSLIPDSISMENLLLRMLYI